MARMIENESVDMETLLKQLPVDLRAKGINEAVRAGGNVVNKAARELAPKGDINHNPGKKALAETIITVVRSYQNDQVFVAIVGPGYPAGAHGHLVEHGHEVVVSRGERAGSAPLSGDAFAEGIEFMAPAVDATAAQQDRAVVDSLTDAFQQAGG